MEVFHLSRRRAKRERGRETETEKGEGENGGRETAERGRAARAPGVPRGTYSTQPPPVCHVLRGEGRRAVRVWRTLRPQTASPGTCPPTPHLPPDRSRAPRSARICRGVDDRRTGGSGCGVTSCVLRRVCAFLEKSRLPRAARRSESDRTSRLARCGAQGVRGETRVFRD